MKVSILVPLVFGIFTKISATPLVYDLNTNVCDGAVTIASTWIGEAKNVEMKSVFCPNSYQRRDVQHVLEQPQTNPVNVCGAPCSTICFTSEGGVPRPNECHVIADALRFDSQRIGPFFEIGTGVNNTVVLKYNSCQTFFLNQSGPLLVYCRTDWAALIDLITPNCPSTQGGVCLANDFIWLVSVSQV